MLRSVAPFLLVALIGCQPQPAADATGDAASKASIGAAVPATPGTPQTEEEKTLYALGLSIGESISVFNLTPAELSMVQSGMTDEISGQTPKVDINTYGPKIQGLAQARGSAQASVEKAAGVEFCNKAAEAPGAEKLPSGLVFQSLTEGGGAAPALTDVVKVNYRGTLRDGTEFDSSYARNEPATFPLGGVIPCLTEGLQKMKVGGKAVLTCPADIAYGDQGSPPVIPGGAALRFEVELLEIVAVK